MNNELFDKCFELIKSSKVRRWHAEPDIPVQTTGDHSWNMILCLLAIHPNPSANLMRAVIMHDLPEKFGCDFPHHVKKNNPELKIIDESFSVIFNQHFGFEEIQLTPEEKLWLSFLDQFEVMLYVSEVDNDTAEEIHNNCYNLCEDYVKKLKTFGYFTEPDETVH